MCALIAVACCLYFVALYSLLRPSLIHPNQPLLFDASLEVATGTDSFLRSFLPPELDSTLTDSDAFWSLPCTREQALRELPVTDPTWAWPSARNSTKAMCRAQYALCSKHAKTPAQLAIMDSLRRDLVRCVLWSGPRPRCAR